MRTHSRRANKIINDGGIELAFYNCAERITRQQKSNSTYITI